ncbi:hypothetical protein ACLMJK_005646 [Lecanora helva]
MYYLNVISAVLTFATSSAVSQTAGGGGGSGCKFAGVNIAGFDFGRDSAGPTNGAEQMAHFVNDDKQNIFRLPVEWDYVTDTSGGPLNQAKFQKYDQLMQACLQFGAYCILDIHSYARYNLDGTNGAVVGQGGPPISDLVNTWTQLAKFYASQEKVVMAIMNEPHDLDVNIWSQTVQQCVTAIRQAGATSQMILLPGSSWASAGDFFGGGGGDLLMQVTNPGGGTENLIFDFHNYFNAPGSSNPECINNGITNAWQPPLETLRSAKRQAMITELGGGGTAQSCLTNVCAGLDFLNQNSDVYLGWTAWSAGAFDASYVMSVLDASGNDVPLMKQCFVAKSYGGGSPGTITPTNGTSSGSPGSPQGNSSTGGYLPPPSYVQRTRFARRRS